MARHRQEMDGAEILAWFVIIPAGVMAVVSAAIVVFAICYTTVWHVGHWVGWW
jgi:hypothetical protein